MNLPLRSVCALLLAAPLALVGCASSRTAPDPAIVRALAPTGTLRTAVYLGSPTSLVRDASGETRGVAVDLGRALAQSLGVPSTLVEFPNNAEALAAVQAGTADLVFTNATPARAQVMDFSPGVLAVEQGFLVPRQSRLESASEVDRAGVRIGVARGSTSEREVSRLVKSATVVAVPTLKDAGRMLADGSLDAFATNKAILYELADTVPGARVLPGAYGRETFAIGIPKGREAGLPWLARFVERSRDDGTVARAVERAGLRGTSPVVSK